MHPEAAASMTAPRIVPLPSPEYDPAKRRFQGIPSVACSPGGRLWAAWYGGPTPAEDQNNYVIVATSADGGATWHEVLAIDPDGPGPLRAYDPEVWLAPDGRLWLFWAQQVTKEPATAHLWAMSTGESDRPLPAWTPPRLLMRGVMMCKPVRFSWGEWCLPVSAWHQERDSATCVVSQDGGRSWALRGACDVPRQVRSFDEHMIVEKKDGSLWMWVRTRCGIGESFSHDRGRSWSALAPSPVRHTSSRFFIGRLSSGNLLLVKNGPIDQDVGRSQLTAFISTDDGRTWSAGLLLDARSKVSYPDAAWSCDGTIYIVHDCDRTGAQEIVVTRLSEEQILAGVKGSACFMQRVVNAPAAPARR